MSLNLDEIKNSGLLELYAMGSLDHEDRLKVEQALKDFPSLKIELEDIEKALRAYALAHAITPPAHIKEQILNEAKPYERTVDQAHKPKFNSIQKLLMSLVALLTLGLVYQQWSFNSKEIKWFSDRQVLVNDCDSTKQAMQTELDQMALLLNANNNIIPVNATEKYPETKLYLHNNETDGINFIQIQNLPSLAANQSFQLWSLKSDQDPIPLDVFESGTDIILPVQFVESSNAYAITIEQRGGATSPNLDQLIGVFSI